MKITLLFLFFLTALVLGQSVHAVVTVTPSIPGLAGGVFKPMTMPTIAGANFSATGTVVVNGKTIPIPGFIPPAGTAGAAARLSMWANPWLTGTALLAWAGEAGLHSDEVGGWSYTDPNGAIGPAVAPILTEANSLNTIGCRSCANTGCLCDVPASACFTNYAPIGVSGRYCHVFDMESGTAVDRGGYAGYERNDATWGPIDASLPVGVQPFGTCPAGTIHKAGTSSCVPGVETRPAKKEDFIALPEPSIEVQRELAPQVGVPVESPVYSPADVPLGEPYTRSDGSTVQPRAKISPAGDGQVVVDTYDSPLTYPNGEPVSNSHPEDTDEKIPTEHQCDKYPNSLGCSELGTVDDVTVGGETRSIAAIDPITTIGGAGSCPEPLTATFMGQTVSFSYDMPCQFATSLKPLILAIAWLSAGLIFIGGVRQ